MAVNTTPVYAGVAFGNIIEVLAANIGTEIDLFPVDALYDRRIDSLTVATDDTAAPLLMLWLSDGTNDKMLTNIPVAVAAGQAALGAMPPCNVLGHTNMSGITQSDSAGNKFMIIPRGCTLRATFTTMTAAKKAWIQVRGWKFADA